MSIPPDAESEKRPPKGIRRGAGHGSKFGRKKEEAIKALLSQRNVEEAARVVGLSPQTLYRWMKIPEFEAAYRDARRASAAQAFARLQQSSGAAVTILLRVMYDLSAPRSARLKAADRVLSCTKATSRMEEIGARLWALKHGRRVLKLPGDRAATANQSESSRVPGHGAKSGPRKEKAIVALLKQKNIDEAARVAGIGTTTLYRWMRDPEFTAEFREAGIAAFGQAGMRLQQAVGSAATTILTIMVDPGAPPWAAVRAADLVLKHATEASEEDIEACLTEVTRLRQGALPGDRRTFEEIPRQRPKAAV